jgi:hypothetical protein
MLFSFTLIPTEGSTTPMTRCVDLAHQIKVSHYTYFGTDFPYHYSVGQTQQESNCRNVISLDGVGSEGVGQITYRLWAKDLKKQGIGDVKSTVNNLRAQAFINYAAFKQARHKHLWNAYQIYNGGGLVNIEIDRAGGRNDWEAAKKACRRKVVHFKGGWTENACDINYDYSLKLYKYGKGYQVVTDSPLYPFW